MQHWERLRYAVICIVTIVWAVNFFAAAIFKDYKTDPAINTVFMTIVGSLFVGGEIVKKWKEPPAPPKEIPPPTETPKQQDGEPK